MPLKIKLRVSGGFLKPFVSQVSRTGAAQKAFAENIGKPVGQCVKGAVSVGMGSGEIKDAVRKCAKATKGKTYSVDAFRGKK